jgi:hypothetical protein
MDKIKTIKCPLKNILIRKVKYKKFNDIIKDANDVYFYCSYFIRSYILYLFENNKSIPIINYNFLRMAFKAISKDSCGPKPSYENKITYNKLCSFFNDIYIKNIIDEPINEKIQEYKLNTNNMSYVFNLYCKEMEVSYMNNIKLNFFKYLFQYINSIFLIKINYYTKEEYIYLNIEHKKKYNNIIKVLEENNKLLRKELMLVKLDLIEDTKNSDIKYHKWIDENKNKILPILDKNKYNTHAEQLEDKYDIYLKYMLYMNNQLDIRDNKLFQPVPLRKSVTNQFVHFDTSCIKDIFGLIKNKKKSEKEEIINNDEIDDIDDELDNANSKKDLIWNELFNIKNIKIPKNYSFNHQISTDGISVSINLILNSEIDKKENRIENMKNASIETKKILKLCNTSEEREIKRNEIKKEKENKKIEKHLIEKQKKQQLKDEFKKLSKEEQNKYKLEEKLKKNKIEYIEDAIKNKLSYDYLKNEYDNKKMIVCDPGKRTLLTMLSLEEYNDDPEEHHIWKIRDNKRLFSYNNRNRLNETKRLEYVKLIDNRKKKIIIDNKTIKLKESELSKFNAKTMNFMRFIKYAQLKLNLRKLIITEKTYNNYINKLKWYSYINRQKHESNLINKIKSVYGDDITIILGDWDDGSRLKYISTPNTHMKKLLKRHFNVYLINEYNTSKLYFRNTKIESDNLNVRINNHNKKIHSVLTFKMGKNMDCINRDYNSTQNMLSILKNLIENKCRPDIFTRKKSITQSRSNVD